MEIVSGEDLVREVVRRPRRKEVLRVGEATMECGRHAIANHLCIGPIEPRQNLQQIIEELASDEVIVCQAIVLLSRKGGVAADAGSHERHIKTGALPDLAIDPYVTVTVD